MDADIFIVGLCGRAGSGKSSVAEHLIENLGAKRISFAAPLKQMAIEIWGFSSIQVYGDAIVKEAIDERWGISPRTAMQKLGTAARNHLGKDIWIKAALDSITEPGFYVIEDVRYRNEAEALKRIGQHVLRLHCSDRISTDDGTHPSEFEVDLIPSEHVDADIYSSRELGLPHLFREVNAALEKIHYTRPA